MLEACVKEADGIAERVGIDWYVVECLWQSGRIWAYSADGLKILDECGYDYNVLYVARGK